MKKRNFALITLGVGSAAYFIQRHIRKKIDFYKNKENIGLGNKGKYNIGNENVGNFNIGCNNMGSQNLGNNNVGQKNYGDFNSGDKNYGFFNIGNNTFGCFNTKKTPMHMFNKRSNMTIDKWLSSEAYEILLEMPASDTDFTLRQIWYDKLPESSKDIIKNIDNFNPKIFERITGICISNNNNNYDEGSTPLLSHSFEPYDDDAEWASVSSESFLPFETAIVSNYYPEEISV